MPASTDIELLYEDGGVLVITKPAGLLTIADRQGGDSVRTMLAEMRPDLAELRVVHRLDRGTSGVLVLAKTLEAQRAMCRQFEERTVEKFYLAIVRGEPEKDHGMIDLRLRLRRGSDQRMMVSITGKRAMTEWTVLERFGGVALLRCELLTGRQHQIRVHLSYVGTPLLVDELYGSSPEFYLSSVKPRYRVSGRHEERPLIDRLTLHAESIEFTPPGKSDRLKITAEQPKDFRATLNQLRRLRGRRPAS